MSRAPLLSSGRRPCGVTRGGDSRADRAGSHRPGDRAGRAPRARPPPGPLPLGRLGVRTGALPRADRRRDGLAAPARAAGRRGRGAGGRARPGRRGRPGRTGAAPAPPLPAAPYRPCRGPGGTRGRPRGGPGGARGGDAPAPAGPGLPGRPGRAGRRPRLAPARPVRRATRVGRHEPRPADPQHPGDRQHRRLLGVHLRVPPPGRVLLVLPARRGRLLGPGDRADRRPPGRRDDGLGRLRRARLPRGHRLRLRPRPGRPRPRRRRRRDRDDRGRAVVGLHAHRPGPRAGRAVPERRGGPAGRAGDEERAPGPAGPAGRSRRRRHRPDPLLRRAVRRQPRRGARAGDAGTTVPPARRHRGRRRAGHRDGRRRAVPADPARGRRRARGHAAAAARTAGPGVRLLGERPAALCGARLPRSGRRLVHAADAAGAGGPVGRRRRPARLAGVPAARPAAVGAPVAVRLRRLDRGGHLDVVLGLAGGDAACPGSGTAPASGSAR